MNHFSYCRWDPSCFVSGSDSTLNMNFFITHLVPGTMLGVGDRTLRTLVSPIIVTIHKPTARFLNTLRGGTILLRSTGLPWWETLSYGLCEPLGDFEQGSDVIHDHMWVGEHWGFSRDNRLKARIRDSGGFSDSSDKWTCSTLKELQHWWRRGEPV